MKKTAVVYARYSSDNQTEQSIEGQLHTCEAYAQSHDIVILDTYIDRAMTGTNDNRPDFQQMLKDSHRQEWDYVLVYKLDRFSRNKYETAMHKKTLRDNGVKLLSAMENIPDTPEGIILESLLEGMAEYYSAELAQKIRRGKRESRLKGKIGNGQITYGYTLVDSKPVIDEEQADVVRYIFAQYANGIYVKDIITALTEKGVLYRGKPFDRSMVYRILANEKYSGIYHIHEEEYDNIYPRIVSQEVFELVRKKGEQNRYGKRSIAVDYLLRGKVKCGYCGHMINAETGTSKTGVVKHYYKCWKRKKGGDCKKSVIAKDVLEQLVLDTILRDLQKPQTMKQLLDQLMELQEQQFVGNGLLKHLHQEKKNIETSINNVMRAIEQGIITATTMKRLQELEALSSDLEAKILKEKNKTALKLTRAEMKAFFEEALKEEPRVLITHLVREIVLFDDHMELYYNTPIQRSPDDNDRGFFLLQETMVLQRKATYMKQTKMEVSRYI